MKKNMGRTDRTVRTVLGIGILVLGLVGGSWWGLVGLIPLGTAFVGFCPAYLPFGISTCSTDVHGGLKS
jgi:hypothetical protein